MEALSDRYVLANLFACGVALALHVLTRMGVIMPGFGVVFVGMVVLLPLFAVTMATHPEARVTRIGPVVVGVRMDWRAIREWTPGWCLAVTGCWMAYVVWLLVTLEQPAHRDAFAPYGPILFTAVFAHLAWSGVGTRLGALRCAEARSKR